MAFLYEDCLPVSYPDLVPVCSRGEVCITGEGHSLSTVASAAVGVSVCQPCPRADEMTGRENVT